MLANYGYEDGSGVYYITINTDVCTTCTEKNCIEGCPESLFVKVLDDFDDEVVVIREEKVHLLVYCCSSCKSAQKRQDELEELPCELVCGKGAIKHTW